MIMLWKTHVRLAHSFQILKRNRHFDGFFYASPAGSSVQRLEKRQTLNGSPLTGYAVFEPISVNSKK